MAVNPVTNKVYLADVPEYNDEFFVVSEQQVQEVPMQVAIQPLAYNLTQNPTPMSSIQRSEKPSGRRT
jgi:DNA-binding beta-propeller fold protein YncE